MDAADLLLTEVRELVRARGIDPIKDNSDLERLVTEAEDDYLRRSDAGLVPPLVDPTGARCHVLDSMAGLGPLQISSTTSPSRRSGSMPPVVSSSPAPGAPS